MKKIILQVNSVFKFGSTGKIVNILHNGIIKNGMKSYIFYGRFKQIKQKNVYFINNFISLSIHYFFSKIFDLHGYFSILNTLILIIFIRLKKPNIVHLHNLHGYYINLFILLNFLKNRKGIKVLITLHDTWMMTGHCTHFYSIKCSKYTDVCNKCPLLNDYPKTYLDNSRRNHKNKISLFKNFNNLELISPSAFLLSLIKKSHLKNIPSTVIPNGIDTSIFDFTNSTTSNSKITLLSIAQNWIEKKGIQDILDISKRINSNIQIILIGKTKNIDQSNFPNIQFIGPINDKKIIQTYYNSSDYYINLSHDETFPTVNLEATCCGLPIISYNTPGSVETLNQFSKVYKFKDYINLSKDINNLVKVSKETKMSISDLGKKIYSQQIMLNKYLDFYGKD